MDWRNVCKKLQEEGLMFDFYSQIQGRWLSDKPWIFTDAGTFRIAAQPILDREDWQEWCRKLQDCGVVFELDAGHWTQCQCEFINKIENYRIPTQPIPAGIEKYLEKEMAEQIMMDGEPLEVGDRVWCLLRGELTVKQLHPSNKDYTVTTESDWGNAYRYNYQFRPSPLEPRTLFWQKPEIIPPPKQKKNVKVWDWVIYNLVDEPSLVLSARTETDLKEKGYLSYRKVEGTEREVER